MARHGRTGPAWRTWAAVVLATVGVEASLGSGAAAASGAAGGARSLPAAWELCILESVGAPVTSADVADLDVWQMGEGGSTDNANSFNPFNTRRVSDQAGTALPAVTSATGFPAFADWPAGCAATVATILQPNMAAIATALAGGGQSPPSAFLATVDRTPWCAPEGGQPCYSGLMVLGIEPASPSRALGLLADSATAVSAFGRAASRVSALEGDLAAQQAELAAAQAAVVATHQVEQAARQALAQLAVYDYTSNPSLDRVASLGHFEAPTQRQQLAQFYERVDLTEQVHDLQQAQAAVRAAVARTDAIESAIETTKAALSSAQADEARWTVAAASDVDALHAAGACPSVPAVPAASPAVAGPAVAALAGCLRSLA
jgi:hypothetical protein